MATPDAGSSETTTTGKAVYIHGAAGPIIVGDYANICTSVACSPAKEGTQSHSKETSSDISSHSQKKTEAVLYKQIPTPGRSKCRADNEYEISSPGCHDSHEKTDHQEPCDYTYLSPTLGSGTLANKGVGKSDHLISSFLENVELSINELDKTAGPMWEEKEKFILQNVLSSLENSYRNSHCRTVACMAMARISCSRSSANVVTYALQQLLRLLQVYDLDDDTVNLLRVEKVVRESINSTDAVFKEERHQEREHRLSLYSQILTMMSIQKARERLVVVDIKEHLSRMQKDLAKYLNPTMGRFRYSIEIIRQTITYLLKPKEKSLHSNVKAFLNECRAKIDTSVNENMDLSFLGKLTNPRKAKNNLFAVHCIVCYLRGKVCSGGIRAGKGALILLRQVIDAWKEGGGGNHWKICMEAASVLSDIATPDVTQGSFNDDKSYMITREKDGAVVREKIVSEEKRLPLHWRRLLKLEHSNICLNLEIRSNSCRRIMEIVSPTSRLGNLKEYILNGSCEQGAIVAFLSQIASALHYLHVNHVVHGNLRAEHVNVVAPCEVQVDHLGRSKSLVPREDETTSKCCVVQADKPLDSTRWSAPEVIFKGHYSHASDVWAFGVVVWEIFAALTFGRKRGRQTLPYCESSSEEDVLIHIQNGGLLSQPHRCPDWLYSVVCQCCSYQPEERPSFIDLFHCLKSRNPMQCWKLWLDHHKREEQSDPSNFLPQNVNHETKGEYHPSKEDHRMRSECLSTSHKYDYIGNQFDTKGCHIEYKSPLYSEISGFSGAIMSLDKSEYVTLLNSDCTRSIPAACPTNKLHKFHTI